MAKPIFTIGVPNKSNKEQIDNLYSILENKLQDYHVLIYYNYKEEVKFDCFYEKDFNKVKYEELKNIVKDRLK